MDEKREITYEDLLDDDDPDEAAVPQSLAQLLANGFPRQGTVDTLAQIIRLDDSATAPSTLRRSFSELLEKQARALPRPR